MLLFLLACRVDAPKPEPEVEDSGRTDTDWYTTGDCDQSNADVHVGADEVCNGYDDDCDGLIDGQDPDLIGGETWYADVDGDGHGDADSTDIGCEAPPGYVASSDDCDDQDPSVPNSEICNGVDDDCDGQVDGSDPDVTGATTWYADADRDGYGDPDTSFFACERPTGYVTDGGDCDDADASVGGGEEVCDDRDNDCDGLVDGADDSVTGGATWYVDADGDGLGDPSTSVEACDRPDGYVADGTDCDDTDATRGGTEVCDDVDNDCDGLTDGQDDSLDGGSVWYRDVDEERLRGPFRHLLRLLPPQRVRGQRAGL